jgi:hypothetical protein
MARVAVSAWWPCRYGLLTGARRGSVTQFPNTGAALMVWKALSKAVVAATFLVGGWIGASGLQARTSVQAGNQPVRAWVQLIGGVQQQIRVVTGAGNCPLVTIDHHKIAMQVRAEPSDPFPGRVCQIMVPSGARQAVVNGRKLHLLTSAPRRILIFGDTGCRLKGLEVQDCNQPAKWPFAAVVRRALAHRPDLVIHVGDYYYRETPCPPQRAGCTGSPFGDDWAAWDADFFAPASPLLEGAPWVFVRGNHEACGRGGVGWFRFLDAGTAPLQCPALSPAFGIDLPKLNLYVLDSSDSPDRGASVDAISVITKQLDAISASTSAGAGWVLTHRPVWGLVPIARLGPIGPLNLPINETEQAALRGRNLDGVQMVVSGHIHHFASFSFGATRPAQLIVGTGGDIGDAADTPYIRSENISIDGLRAQSLTFERFGFLLLERRGDDWTGVFRDTADRPVAACRLRGRNLVCEPVASKH